MLARTENRLLYQRNAAQILLMGYLDEIIYLKSTTRKSKEETKESPDVAQNRGEIEGEFLHSFFVVHGVIEDLSRKRWIFHLCQDQHLLRSSRSHLLSNSLRSNAKGNLLESPWRTQGESTDFVTGAVVAARVRVEEPFEQEVGTRRHVATAGRSFPSDAPR